MIAAAGLPHKQAFDLVHGMINDLNKTGRILAHAMAHGFYGCRSFVVYFNESSGTFGVIRDSR